MATEMKWPTHSSQQNWHSGGRNKWHNGHRNVPTSLALYHRNEWHNMVRKGWLNGDRFIQYEENHTYNSFRQTEVPMYGSGKLGTIYPQEQYSAAYELTDHLGNVRALIKDDIEELTATMEDNGTADYTNPRVREMVVFENLFETEKRDARFNHTPGGEYSAYVLPGHIHVEFSPTFDVQMHIRTLP